MLNLCSFSLIKARHHVGTGPVQKGGADTPLFVKKVKNKERFPPNELPLTQNMSGLSKTM
jgi:hypothetical protein